MLDPKRPPSPIRFTGLFVRSDPQSRHSSVKQHTLSANYEIDRLLINMKLFNVPTPIFTNTPNMTTTTHLQKRKDHHEDSGSDAAPSVDAGKDVASAAKGVAASTITTTTTTVTSTVTVTKEGSAVSTVHETDTKTVTVTGSVEPTTKGVNATSGADITTLIPLSETSALDRALLGKPTSTTSLTGMDIPSATCLPTATQSKKQISPAAIAAIIFGLLTLTLTVLMVFLVRKFYMMYRAERVLRKQAQTEGNELRKMNGEVVVGGTTVVDRPAKALWGLKRKDSWE